MQPVRLSSAILLTRGAGDGLELYVVRRAKELRFFGGYWALPGGVIDAADHDGDPGARDAHRRCGLRELFEEVGVLPRALRALLGAERDALRAGLLADGAPAARRMRALLDAAPWVLDELEEFGELTTPPFAPVRYQTRFLHLALPDGEQPSIHPGELIAGEFMTARELLDTWRTGERLVVPPALYFLELLERLGLPAFLADARGRCAEHQAGRLHRIRNTPGVLMAALRSPTLPPATTTNCYVVGERRLFVIDPAPYEEDERARLCAFLDELRAEGREVAGVLPTHHHKDHVGAVALVAERYGCPVYGHPLTLARLPFAPRDARPIGEGDVLELGAAPDGAPGWQLRAYHTPGHDRGHLVLLESRYRALLAGDLCSTASTIVIEPPEGHLATYLASLRRMRAVELGVLYPAHGPAARNGHALIERYLEHRALRERMLVGALSRAGSATVEELVPEVYADTPRALHGLAASSLLAGLEKLAEDGDARCVAERWSLAGTGTGDSPA